MTQCLFVVIGAGASYDSTSPENVGVAPVPTRLGYDRSVAATRMRPPLVTELFDQRFAGILNKYPLAQMAASDIRRRRSTPVAIEEFLREQYRDSSDDLDRRKFHAVHWYLQDLLWCASRFYTTHPDNYDRLLTGCLRLPRVVFITLNYDTLLDDRLRIVRRIDNLDAYTRPGEQWGLVKLHGSVDWRRRITSDTNSIIVTDTPPNIDIADEIVLRTNREDINLIRQTPAAGSRQEWYYPALSVPVGTRDRFSCPRQHVDYLREALALQSDGLDVLMLGYSALDEEVLRLFEESGKYLRSLMIVNANEESAVLAYQRVTRLLGHGIRTSVPYQRSFADFVGTDDFDRYLSVI